MQNIKGSFRYEDLTVNYDFQLIDKKPVDVIFRMRFNSTEVREDDIFVCGLMLMHYLANDCGLRIDMSQVPRLESEEAAYEAAEKFSKGEKQ